MKAYKYQIDLGKGRLQMRAYVPGYGVFGYTKETLDFFSDNEGVIFEAIEMIASSKAGNNARVKYLGKYSFSQFDDLKIMEAASSGKRSNKARAEFERAWQPVKGLVED